MPTILIVGIPPLEKAELPIVLLYTTIYYYYYYVVWKATIQEILDCFCSEQPESHSKRCGNIGICSSEHQKAAKYEKYGYNRDPARGPDKKYSMNECTK
jgi:hypothetical protein